MSFNSVETKLIYLHVDYSELDSQLLKLIEKFYTYNHKTHVYLQGEWVSMGVISNGTYGIPEGIFYSFPCTIDSTRNWSVVQVGSS